MQTRDQVNDSLKKYLEKAFQRIYLRKQGIGLIKQGISKNEQEREIKSETEDFYKKVEEFVKDHQKMCAIWNGPVCEENRRIESEKYGKVHLLENNCIDGRIVRGFKGEADILQTEKAVIAVDVVESDGEMIPRSPSVCSTLADTSKEPLVFGIAHFDSADVKNGCAAIDLALKDPQAINEKFWRFLSEKEKDLVFQARSRSMEEANLVLIKLTSSRAVTNYTNDVRIEHGLTPLPRAAIVASYDTRTMGIVVKAPIFELNIPIEDVKLAPFDREYISTTEFTLDMKNENLVKEFEFGSFMDNFYKTDSFEEFSTAVTKLTVLLSEKKSKWTQKVLDFIEKYYSDLTNAQKQAFLFRFFRTISHQYLTGLAETRDKHPFSNHDERYISASEDARFFGKYQIDEQSFIVHIPDEETGALRIDIGASVMDKTGVDHGKPHALFIASSINKEVFENREKPEYAQMYSQVVNNNNSIFRQLNTENSIINRISNGNLVPIGVLLNSDTGEVLEVVTENYRYL